jgi:hypothetical protein
MTPQDAITKLSAFITIHDRKKYPWLGTPARIKGLYDCAAAVSWVLGVNPEITSCGVWEQHFKDRKTWHTTGIPIAGDLVIFDWETGLAMGKNQNHDHIGIVISADAKGVTYVSADSTRPTPGYVTKGWQPYKFVTGFGRPNYGGK